ncbi:MAG: hypothetical protein AB1Z98_03980 [Nannocystaceae bacterium]
MKRAPSKATTPLFSLLAMLAVAGCDPDASLELDSSETSAQAFRTGELSISPRQWGCISSAGLGLRSGVSADDWEGPASYAMSYGTDPFQPPSDFDALLLGTMQQITGFPNAAGRTLIINYGVRDTSDDYSCTFPKTSSKARGFYTSTPIGTQSAQALAGWVVANIPEAPCDIESE